MIIKQYFHTPTSTYTYLLADETTHEAMLIDPVNDEVTHYIKALHALELKLIAAVDTHIHADHVTALGLLRKKTGAKTYLGLPHQVSCADAALKDNLIIRLGNSDIKAIHTPGHTEESFCFYIRKDNILFSGDTLLINSTGRTDFQNGDAEQLFDSLHNTLLKLPDETVIYPGHDYHGKKRSTIGNERRENPHLTIKDKAAFKIMMHQRQLPDPKFMHIAVPSNLNCGEKPQQQSKG
ncbi:MAG: MBL fold metallo-hydrolase [Cellvibrionales bacterium]|nr:MBL fold metallo-hydrolase [Cellvibrionales bacterium]